MEIVSEPDLKAHQSRETLGQNLVIAEIDLWIGDHVLQFTLCQTSLGNGCSYTINHLKTQPNCRDSLVLVPIGALDFSPCFYHILIQSHLQVNSLARYIDLVNASVALMRTITMD